MIQDKGKFWKEILKATVKITLAGILIGYLHEYDTVVALILLLKAIHSIYDLGFKNGEKNWIVPIGMVITGIIGIGSEYIGVTYNHWEYHDIGNHLPHWLVLAWMLSFSFIYKIERGIFESLANKSIQNKIIWAMFVAFLFPVFGEVITIHLGVWTYHIPYQFLGIPFLVYGGLPLIHLFINGMLFYINKKYKIKDPVFSIVKK
jgi:hypothetical protein